MAIINQEELDKYSFTKNDVLIRLACYSAGIESLINPNKFVDNPSLRNLNKWKEAWGDVYILLSETLGAE